MVQKQILREEGENQEYFNSGTEDYKSIWYNQNKINKQWHMFCNPQLHKTSSYEMFSFMIDQLACPIVL